MSLYHTIHRKVLTKARGEHLLRASSCALALALPVMRLLAARLPAMRSHAGGEGPRAVRGELCGVGGGGTGGRERSSLGYVR